MIRSQRYLMTPSHRIVLSRTENDRETPLYLISSVPLVEGVMEDFHNLDSLDVVHIDLDEDTEDFLDKLRRRKRDCGSYLLDRDIVIHVGDADVRELLKKYDSMASILVMGE